MVSKIATAIRKIKLLWEYMVGPSVLPVPIQITIIRKIKLLWEYIVGRSVLPIPIQDVARPITTFGERIFFGDGNCTSSRGIYELSEITVFKEQLLLTPKDGKIINIIGAKALRRNEISKISGADSFALSKLRVISHSENKVFVFIPHNKKKNNYWHCLFDNISQLLFILQYGSVSRVIIPRRTGVMIDNYVRFLKNYYDFELSYLGERPLKLIGQIVFTEPSLLGGFENNELIAQRFRNLAREVVQESGGRIVKEVVKFGSIPHFFQVLDKSDNVLNYKNFYSPWTTPIRKSSLDSLRKFGALICGDSQSRHRITYIVRKSIRNRNPINESALQSELKQNLDIDFVDFSQLTYAEQITVAFNTSLLIGVNGAGLANMAFMQKPGTVIEIIPPHFSLPPSQIIEAPANGLGLNYKAIVGRQESNDFSYKLDCGDVVKIVLHEARKLRLVADINTTQAKD